MKEKEVEEKENVVTNANTEESNQFCARCHVEIEKY